MTDPTVEDELTEAGIKHPAAVERVRQARAAGVDVPAKVIAMYPYARPDAWERLSDIRFRAPHPNGASVVLVVDLYGETLGGGSRIGPDEERVEFGRLIEHASTLVGHRVACEQRTPVVRPNSEANRGVAGRCWWCGTLPEHHVWENPEDAQHLLSELADCGGTHPAASHDEPHYLT